MIHVRPDRARRRDFARWATGHAPKLRTVGVGTFAVPPRLFVDAPEELLVGAVVDGHPYRSPLEDEATGTPPPGTGGLVEPVLVGETGPETVIPLSRPGAVLAERTAVLGEALPLVPEPVYSPDSIPLPPPEPELADEPADEQLRAGGAPSEREGAPYACDVCARSFASSRGRDTHRRQVHPEG